MTISDDLKTYLQLPDTQKLIGAEKWSSVYEYCPVQKFAELSEFLLSLAINPFEHDREIYERAFCNSDIVV